LSVDDASYILDRIVVVGWVLTTPLWLAGYYRSTLWISYGLALLTVFDIVLHFRAYKSSLVWLVLVLLGWVGFIHTRTWNASFETSQRIAQETETHGWLVPPNETLDRYPCKGVSGSNALTILLGRHGIGASVPITDDRRDICVLAIAGCGEVVSMKHGSDGLMFNVTVRNKAGQIVAQVKDNEFHLVQNEISYAEHSDPSTLTVNDPYGNEVFYAHYLNPQLVELRGIFHCGENRGLLVTDEKVLTPYGSTLIDFCGASLGECAVSF
jgi:hypothetical protein